MRAAVALVHAEVAKAPVSVITFIASPIALIGPGTAARTEHAAFEALRGVICREGLAAFCTAWRGVRYKITISGELMRLIKRVTDSNTLPLPIVERSIPKSVPM